VAKAAATREKRVLYCGHRGMKGADRTRNGAVMGPMRGDKIGPDGAHRGKTKGQG
jgi:hypothetical protein